MKNLFNTYTTAGLFRILCLLALPGSISGQSSPQGEFYVKVSIIELSSSSTRGIGDGSGGDVDISWVFNDIQLEYGFNTQGRDRRKTYGFECFHSGFLPFDTKYGVAYSETNLEAMQLPDGYGDMVLLEDRIRFPQEEGFDYNSKPVLRFLFDCFENDRGDNCYFNSGGIFQNNDDHHAVKVVEHQITEGSRILEIEAREGSEGHGPAFYQAKLLVESYFQPFEPFLVYATADGSPANTTVCEGTDYFLEANYLTPGFKGRDEGDLRVDYLEYYDSLASAWKRINTLNWNNEGFELHRNDEKGLSFKIPAVYPPRNFRFHLNPNFGAALGNHPDFYIYSPTKSDGTPLLNVIPAPPNEVTIETPLACIGEKHTVNIMDVPGARVGEDFQFTLQRKKVEEDGTVSWPLFFGAGNPNRTVTYAGFDAGMMAQYTGLPDGEYRLAVSKFTLSGEVALGQCTKFKKINLQSIPFPDFEIETRNVSCTGELGYVKVSLDPIHNPVSIRATNIENGAVYVSDEISYTYLPLPVGNYTVEVINFAGCSTTYPQPIEIRATDSSEIEITSLNRLEHEGTFYDAICGGELAQISIIPQNGQAPYFLRWQVDGVHAGARTYTAGEEIVLELERGNYTFEMSSITTCSSTKDLVINLPTEPLSVAPSTAITASACTPDGQIILGEVSGGMPPYRYSLDGQEPVTDPDFSDLYYGYHLVDITDALGCTMQTVHFIDAIEGIQIDTILQQDPVCSGASGGSLDVRLSGGALPYQYQLNDGPFSDQGIFDGLSAGLYKIRVKDAAGCEQVAFVTLRESPPLTIAEIRVLSPPVCQGEPAQLGVLVRGGNGGNKFSIDGAAFIVPDTQMIYARFYQLQPGNHTVQVKDQAGCLSAISNFTIEDPEPLALSVGTTKDVSCLGDQNGSIRLHPTGGYTPYTIIVNRGTDPVDTIQSIYSNSLVISDLSPGGYHFSLIDGKGCRIAFTDEVVIGEPSVLSGSATSTGEDIIPCSGASNGEVTVLATGGTGPYAYSLNGLGFQDNPVLGNAMPNNQFFVRDSRGCIYSDSISIPLGPLLTADVLQTQPISSCSQGAVLLNVKDFRGDLRISIERSTPTSPCGGILHTPIKGDTSEEEKSGEAVKADNKLSFLIKNNNFNTDTTFWVNGISGGPQCITIQDEAGCNTFVSATIGFSQTRLETMATTDVSCLGTQDGTATIGFSGSTAFYLIRDLEDTLQFTAPDQLTPVEAILTDLSAGPHSLVLIDAHGCLQTGEFIIGNATEFTPIIDQTNFSGCGFEDYRTDVNISFSAGTAPFTVGWPDSTPGTQNETGTQRFGLPPNEYEVLVSDANGCQDSVVFYIAPVDTFSVEVINMTSPDCMAAAGAVQLYASGGTEPYQYTVDFVNFQDDGVFQDLAGGSYIAKAVDAGGCEELIAFEIQPFQKEYFNVSTIPVSCTGLSDGGIKIETGVSGNFLYMLNGEFVSGGDTIKGLSAGNYSLSIIGESSCELVYDDLVITDPAPLHAGATILNASTCGQFNAVALNQATGGAGAYTYQWNFQPANSLDTAYSLPPGENRLIVTDAMECRDTQLVSINSSASLAIFPTVEPANCGANNGSISLNISGGQEPLTFRWKDPSLEGRTLTGLAPALYEVAVVDANGCSTSRAISVGVNEPTRLELQSVSPQICDLQLGQITVEAFGGDGNYTYQWSHDSGPGGAVAEGLRAGTYTLTLTDGMGCEALLTETVAFTAGPTVEIEGIELTDCVAATGAIAVNISDGQLPYEYTWSHDSMLSGSIADALAAGTYSLTVTDNNGCQSSVEATVETANGPSVELLNVVDSPCTEAEGSITIGGQGGTVPYSYSWSHESLLNQSTAESLAPGVYTVTLTDFRGCTAEVSATVLPTGGPAITLDSLSHSLCVEGSGYLRIGVSNGSAPFDYQWDLPGAANSPTLENLSSGVYQLTLTDSDGCVGTFSQEIRLEDGPSITLLEKDSSFCEEANGRLRVEAVGTGPIAYTWNHDNQLTLPEASGLSAGNYTVTATDVNGCTDVLSEVIPDLPPPVLNTLAVENNSCGEQIGSIRYELLGGSGPYFISWSHDAALNTLHATHLDGGTYQISVEDSNGCLVVDTTEIINENGPEAILQINNSRCTDGTGSITTAVSGGAAPFTYAWSNGVTNMEGTLSDLAAGTYTVTITDQGGCQTQASGELLLEDGPTVAVQSFQNTLCVEGNGRIRLQPTGTGPFSYRWSHDPELNLNLATALEAGTYTISVSDAYQCEVVVQQEIELIAGPTAVVTQVDSSFCNVDNGRIQLAVNGGTGTYTYAWSHSDTLNANLAESLASNDYQITITDANSCSVVVDTTVQTYSEPVLELVRTQGSTCAAANGEIEVLAKGGMAPYTYTWRHNSELSGNILTGLTGGTYQVMATDNRGCSVQQQITINNTDGPNVELLSLKNSLCTNDNGLISLNTTGGTGPYTYQWSHDNTLNAATAGELAAGEYEITVTDGNNCTVNLSYELEFEPNPMLEVQSAVDSDCGPNNGRIQINPIGNAPLTVSWSHDPELSGTVAEGLAADKYTITLTDSNACTETFDVELGGTDAIEINNLSVTPPSCNGSVDGQISFDLAGGDGNYQVSWSHDDTLTATTAPMLASNIYQVAVEDGLGCQAEELITLADIPVLSAAASLQSPSCFGATDGSIVVEASGGNGNYEYKWSVAGASNSDTLAGLSTGIYQLTLSDEKGCTLQKEFALSAQTTALRINLVENSVVQPPCAGDASGSFSVVASGGAGAYSYLWSNGANTADLEQIPSGIYELTLTDDKGCVATFTYDLEPSGALSTDLVFEDVTICEGSGLTIDYTAEDYDFVWSGPNGFTSTAKKVKLSQAGAYTVRISSGNCVLDETFNIELNPQPFQTLFIVPTEVVAGDTIVAYEVSWPIPDALNWQYDQDSVQYLGQDQNQHFFHFPYTGEFELGLEAGLNTCSDLLQKTIRVVADSSQLDLPLDPGTREFESITISPNPNNGQFEVAIEMTRAIDVDLTIYDALSELKASQTGSGQQSYRFSFQEDLVPGAYVLFVKGEQEQRVLTFVVVN